MDSLRAKQTTATDYARALESCTAAQPDRGLANVHTARGNCDGFAMPSTVRRRPLRKRWTVIDAIQRYAVTELAAAFEEHRSHLRGVAYRMLGSASEADDAVQNAWLKVTHADTAAVENLRAWLTTVVSRVCLDMLRSRASRREDSLADAPERAVEAGVTADRDLAESVGIAVMIVLDQLAPPERLAFVLHDMFGMSFDEIGPIINRSSAAARQLASRARRRVQGATAPEIDLPTQRRVVDSFIAALRAGDVQALVQVLGGNEEWAKGAVAYRKATGHMRSVLVDGRVGLVLTPGGKIQRVLIFTFDGETIRDAEIVIEPDVIAELVIEELA